MNYFHEAACPLMEGKYLSLGVFKEMNFQERTGLLSQKATAGLARWHLVDFLQHRKKQGRKIGQYFLTSGLLFARYLANEYILCTKSNLLISFYKLMQKDQIDEQILVYIFSMPILSILFGACSVSWG